MMRVKVSIGCHTLHSSSPDLPPAAAGVYGRRGPPGVDQPEAVGPVRKGDVIDDGPETHRAIHRESHLGGMEHDRVAPPVATRQHRSPRHRGPHPPASSVRERPHAVDAGCVGGPDGQGRSGGRPSRYAVNRRTRCRSEACRERRDRAERTDRSRWDVLPRLAVRADVVPVRGRREFRLSLHPAMVARHPSRRS